MAGRNYVEDIGKFTWITEEPTCVSKARSEILANINFFVSAPRAALMALI